MRRLPLIALAAMLALAACNQNAPTNTDLPTDAGETIPAVPLEPVAIEDGAVVLEPQTETPQPVPEEYSGEEDTVE